MNETIDQQLLDTLKQLSEKDIIIQKAIQIFDDTISINRLMSAIILIVEREKNTTNILTTMVKELKSKSEQQITGNI